jgi:hypothetical protein
MGPFGILFLLLLGLILIALGYVFDEKLRTQYHVNAPLAMILAGGFVSLIAGLTYLRMTYFKKGKFFDYLGVSVVTDMLIRAA